MELEKKIEKDLKSFASFLQENHLHDFALEMYKRARELNLPILQHLSKFSEDEIIALNKNRATLVLNSFINETAIESLKSRIKQWKEKKSEISIEEFSPADAALANNVLKISLLRFIEHFTNDVIEFKRITLEIEDYFTKAHQLTVETYLKYQKDILTRQKEFAETLVDNSEDEILAFDKDLRYIAWNKRLADNLNMPKEQVLGKYIFDIYPQYKDTYVGRKFQDVLKGERISFPPEYYPSRKKYLQMNIVPLLHKGEIIGGLTFVKDVTETREKELLLLERERINKDIQSLARIGIYEWSAETNMITWNDDHFRIYGYEPGELPLMPETIEKTTHPESQDYRNNLMMKLFSEPGNYDYEHKIIRKDGSAGVISGKVVSVTDEQGKVVKVLGYAQDITDKKEAQEILKRTNAELEVIVRQRTEALKENERNLSLVMNSVPALISWIDKDEIYRYVNKSYQKWFGKTSDEIIGRSIKEFLGESAHNLLLPHIQKALAGEESHFESEVPYKYGNTKIIKASYIPRKNEKGKVNGFIALVVDITETKKLEQEIRRSEANLKDFIENANQGLHWVDGDATIIWANNAEMDMLGYAEEEYIGQSIKKFHVDQEKIEDILARLGRKEILHNYEARLKCKDGSIKTVLIDSSGLWEGDKFIHTRCFTRDISEIKEAQDALRKKNEELIRINNDLDNFIYSASHDLKSPIANLEGLLSMISAEEAGLLTKEGMEVLPLIDQSMSRLRNVIKELTEIARIQKDIEDDYEFIELNEIFNDIILSCEQEIRHFNVDVFADFSEAPQLKFSRRNLRSILSNLISNAVKYSSPEKESYLRIKSFPQRENIIIEIEDNGLGIPDSQKEKVFTMFKRLHTHVEGSGVGLYIVKRIIENAGGSIELKSEVGKGSTFILRFPVKERIE